jgi:hypothetical protein
LTARTADFSLKRSATDRVVVRFRAEFDDLLDAQDRAFTRIAIECEHIVREARDFSPDPAPTKIPH